MNPKPNPNSRWTIKAEEETQILLEKDNGLSLAIERRAGEGGAVYLVAAGFVTKKVRWSASAFRASVTELYPGLRWGKLPRHSRFGFRAIAKVEEP